MTTRKHPTTTATKNPVGWSAAKEKALFEDTLYICNVVKICVDATIRRYAADSPYLEQLKAKRDALTDALTQLIGRLEHITYILRVETEATAYETSSKVKPGTHSTKKKTKQAVRA